MICVYLKCCSTGCIPDPGCIIRASRNNRFSTCLSLARLDRCMCCTGLERGFSAPAADARCQQSDTEPKGSALYVAPGTGCDHCPMCYPGFAPLCCHCVSFSGLAICNEVHLSSDTQPACLAIYGLFSPESALARYADQHRTCRATSHWPGASTNVSGAPVYS